MCSSGRAAALYVNPKLIEEYESSYRFYWRVYNNFQWSNAPFDRLDHDNINSWSGPLVKTAERFDPGCVGEDAQCGFHASLEYFNNLGINKIEKRVLGLSGYLIDGLKDLGLKINTPYNKENRAGIVTYTLDKYKKNVNSYEALKHEGIIAAHRYTGGVGGIRISPHFFNTEKEIDSVLNIQKKLLT